MIMSTLALRLKAVESFLETKIRIPSFYPVLAKIRMKKDFYKEKRYKSSVPPVLAKIRINLGLLYFQRNVL